MAAITLAILLLSAPLGAETLRATAHAEGQVRLVTLVKDGESLYLPLFACGGLLTANARWDRGTNRWEMRGANSVAQGFLDEPLVNISGALFMVKNPPRLIGGIPHLSLEVVRLLGRHGWEADVSWEPTTKELSIRPAQDQPAAAVASRTIAVPEVPPGSPIVALDPGHSRRTGISGVRGGSEGDFGLRICTALSATMMTIWGAPVILRGEGDELTVSEVASLANAVRADIALSLHGSVYGEPGITVWCWGTQNMAGTGINFSPFEPAGGWCRVADAQSGRSLALARRLVKQLQADGIPARGPFTAPLACLQGITCPSMVLDFEGLSTVNGAALVNDEEKVAEISASLARVLMQESTHQPGEGQ